MSILDQPIAVTMFRGAGAQSKVQGSLSLRRLAQAAENTSAATKADLPWIKLATFGEQRTPKGSLRSNANTLAIHGIEGDYDGGVIGPEQAADMLRGANLAALVYTSPSHTDEKPRWRVVCPLSAAQPPDARKAMVARVNGALGGVLAGESFTLSQAYYIGFVKKQPKCQTWLIDGRALDLAAELPAVYPPAAAALPPLNLPPATPPDERAKASMRAALDLFQETQEDRHQRIIAATLALAPYVLSGHLDQAEVCAELDDAVVKSGREPNDGEIEGAMTGALAFAQPYVPPSDGSEFEPLPGEPARPGIRGFWNPWENAVCGPPFPMDLLPRALREIVEDTHWRIGTDRAAVAMAYIAGIGGAIHAQTSLRAMKHSDWTENPRLWVALVGDPSSKKSPLLSRVVQPYRAHEDAERTAYDIRLADWETADKKTRGRQPQPPTVILNDVTPEKAAELLRPRGALMYADELSAWIGNMDKYTGKTASARPFWLQAYEGGSYRQDRITRGHVHVSNLSISLLGGIQMDRLAKLAKLDGLTDDGLLQRFLPVIMEAAEHATDLPAAVDHGWYRNYVRALLDGAPKEWMLDTGGHRIKEEALRRYQERTLAERHHSKAFSGWMGKCQAFVIRLALTLRYLDPTAPDDSSNLVPASTMRDAVRLLDDFLIPHAQAFYDGLSQAVEDDMLALAGWILAREKDTFVASDLTDGPRAFNGLKVREINEKLSRFIGADWITPDTAFADCRKWHIAPGLREQLADRAKASAEALKRRHEAGLNSFAARAAEKEARKFNL